VIELSYEDKLLLEKWGFTVKEDASRLEIFYQNYRIATFENSQPINLTQVVVKTISLLREQLFPNVVQVYIVEGRTPCVWVVLKRPLPVIQINFFPRLRQKSYVWEVRHYRTKQVFMKRRYSLSENPLNTLRQVIAELEKYLTLEVAL